MKGMHSMFAGRLRSVAAILVCFAVAVPAGFSPRMAAAQQPSPVKLFKMITAKDEVVIGLTDAELRSFGLRADIDNLAERLVSAGQIAAWQYAVKKAADGSLVQAPLRRIAVFKSDTLRIEPYNPAPLKALPPE
jgi:hypothetical protein